MAEERVNSRIETNSEFSQQVMSEINSLREELATIRRLLERGHSLSQAIEEYRYLPSNLEDPIRWGFIGTWGKGGSSCTYSIMTMNQDGYFEKPHSSDEVVADFAAAFTNPNTIKVCKYFFRNKERSREEIKKGCKLSDEELDAAVKLLLEWYFAEWKDGMLENVEHGVNYVVTLVGMAQVAFDNKVRREASETG